MEQQFPFGQFPQTVFLLPVPQVPSVVTAAVDVAPGAIVDVAGAMTGSPEVVVPGAFATAHPFWHSFAAWQCAGVEPQYLPTVQVSSIALKTHGLNK